MAESRTEEKKDFVERLVGGSHYETTIHEKGILGSSVKGAGDTPEEAQENASRKWNNFKEEEDC